MRRRQGFILVEALIVIAGLIALMAIIAANERASIQNVQNRLRHRRAEVAAQSAIARAVAVLQSANTNLVTLNDDWALLGDSGNREFDLVDSTFRLQIVDANSLININTASAAQCAMLPISQDLIDCLLDWRETSLQPRSDGAKDDYYRGLQQPYNTRLGPLTTLNELLLIKGWTAKQLYAVQTETVSTAPTPEDDRGNELPLISLFTVSDGAPNTQAGGQPRINLNRPGINPAVLAPLGLTGTLAVQVARGAPYPSFRALLSRPGLNTTQNAQRILNAVTFTNGRLTGKINVNTATQAVLQTLPTMTPGIAEFIVSRQASGFTGLGDLTSVPGVSGATLASLADAACVGGDTWIVRAYGQSGGVGAAVEALIVVSNGKAQIKTYERVNASGIPAWWDWETEPTSTVDAGASQ